MHSNKRYISLLMVFVLTIFCLIGFVSTKTMAAGKPKVVAKATKVTPILNGVAKEYNLNDVVKVSLTSKKVATKVSYKILVVNTKTKKTIDVTKGYTKPISSAKPVSYKFNASVSGIYTITAYAKAAGIKNSSIKYIKQNFSVYNGVALRKAKAKVASKTVNGDLYIGADNITVSNVKVKGTVFVNPGKNGTANLKNVVASNIKVMSGGTNSIHFDSVSADMLTVDSTSNVRIETKGTTQIGDTVIVSYAILDSKGGTLGTVTISKPPKGGTPIVELRGTFDEPVVIDSNSIVNIADGASLSSLDVKSEATITSATGSEVQDINIAPAKKGAKVTLNGDYNNVSVNSEANVMLGNNTNINGQMDINAAAKLTVPNTSEVTYVEVNTKNKYDKVEIDGSNVALVHMNSAATIAIGKDSKANIAVDTDGVKILAASGATVNLDTKDHAVATDSKDKTQFSKVDLTNLSNAVEDKLSAQATLVETITSLDKTAQEQAQKDIKAVQKALVSALNNIHSVAINNTQTPGAPVVIDDTQTPGGPADNGTQNQGNGNQNQGNGNQNQGNENQNQGNGNQNQGNGNQNQGNGNQNQVNTTYGYEYNHDLNATFNNLISYVNNNILPIFNTARITSTQLPTTGSTQENDATITINYGNVKLSDLFDLSKKKVNGLSSDQEKTLFSSVQYLNKNNYAMKINSNSFESEVAKYSPQLSAFLTNPNETTYDALKASLKGNVSTLNIVIAQLYGILQLDKTLNSISLNSNSYSFELSSLKLNGAEVLSNTDKVITTAELGKFLGASLSDIGTKTLKDLLNNKTIEMSLYGDEHYYNYKFTFSVTN